MKKITILALLATSVYCNLYGQITNAADMNYNFLLVVNEGYKDSDFSPFDIRPTPSVLADSLKQILLRKYIVSNIETIIDKGKHDIVASIDKLNAKWKLTTDKSSMFILFIGHGYIDEERRTYFVPQGGIKSDPSTLLDHSAIAIALRSLKVKHLAIVSISCHSAGMIEASKAFDPHDRMLAPRQAAGTKTEIPPSYRPIFNQRSIELACSLDSMDEIDEFPSDYLIGMTRVLNFFPVSQRGTFLPFGNFLYDADLEARNRPGASGGKRGTRRVAFDSDEGQFVFVVK